MSLLEGDEVPFRRPAMAYAWTGGVITVVNLIVGLWCFAEPGSDWGEGLSYLTGAALLLAAASGLAGTLAALSGRRGVAIALYAYPLATAVLTVAAMVLIAIEPGY